MNARLLMELNRIMSAGGNVFDALQQRLGVSQMPEEGRSVSWPQDLGDETLEQLLARRGKSSGTMEEGFSVPPLAKYGGRKYEDLGEMSIRPVR